MSPQVLALDETGSFSLFEPEDSSLNNAQGQWIRSCPICQSLLSKTSPQASTRCECGWEWRG
jgi:hypothetical protein